MTTADRQKLSEQAITDLGNVASKKVNRSLVDVLQLVEDNGQRMVIATHVAAGPFGMAARFMQEGMREKGMQPEWKECVEAVVRFVAKMALETPPDDSTAVIRGAGRRLPHGSKKHV